VCSSDLDGSGDIRVGDVSGDFVTGDTGSGDLEYNNVTGLVSMTSRQ